MAEQMLIDWIVTKAAEDPIHSEMVEEYMELTKLNLS